MNTSRVEAEMRQITPNLGVSRAPRSSSMSQRRKRKAVVEKFVSQNAQGMKSDEHLEELVSSMNQNNVFAACLQETWRTGKESLIHGDCQLLFAGLNVHRSRRGEQGVGIALSAEAVLAWKAVGSTLYNDFGARIIAVRLCVKDIHGKDIFIFLVSVYAPVGNADQDLWDSFFDNLDRCIAKKEHGDILIIGSDLNSSMGCNHNSNVNHRKSLGNFGLDHVNNAGIRTHSYLEISRLIALTTCFRKRQYATWLHPRSKLPHQIDHFLTDKSEFFRFTDAGVTRQLVDSDHQAIMCKVRIMSRLKKCTPLRKRLCHLDYSLLLHDEGVAQSFCEKVADNFNTAQPELSTYSRLSNSVQAAALETVPKKGRPQPGWFDAAKETLLPLIEKRNQASTCLFQRRSRASTLHLRATRKAVKCAVAKAKSDWIMKHCNTMNEAGVHGTKQSWDAVNMLRSGLSKSRPSANRMMTKEDGTKCSSPEENAEVFRSHFERLYGRADSIDATILNLLEQHKVAQDCVHIPTDKEIIVAVRKLKNAPGESGITPQVWQAVIKCKDTFAILKLCIREFWENEVTPNEWEKCLLKIIAKKGDLSLAGNYRGIMLLETAYKIVAILIHERLQPIAEGLDHESQCGFRPQRGCTDAVFTLKLAMKKRREHGQESWILFLDLVKAFDRVPRQMLWDVLLKLGVPQKLVRLLQSLHANVEVNFSINEVSQTITCTIGVKQGDVLGPILFTFYMAAVMITWRIAHQRPLCIFNSKMDDVLTGRRWSTKGLAFSLDDSEYADDTAVLFVTRESMIVSIPAMIAHFARFGMDIHVGKKVDGTVQKPSKTEILFVAKPDQLYVNPSNFDGCDLSDVDLGDGHFLPVVDKFKYLGSILTRDCKDFEDVKNRIEAAGNAFGSLRHCIFASTNLTFDAKRVVYESLILTILLYGAETWCLTESTFHQLRLFHARCVRTMCRVNRLHTRVHRISTASLLGRLGLQSIDIYVTKKQLRWAGHVWRMDWSRLPRKMLTCWVREPRPRGCPEFTYGRGLRKALKKANVALNSWTRTASNRSNWRKVIQAI